MLQRTIAILILLLISALAQAEPYKYNVTFFNGTQQIVDQVICRPDGIKTLIIFKDTNGNYHSQLCDNISVIQTIEEGKQACK